MSRAVLTASLLMLPALAAGQDVKIDFDKAFDFSTVKTYSIKLGTPWGNDLGERRVLAEIDEDYAQDERGQGYVLFKTDGNGENPKEDTVVYAQRVSADGLTLLAEEPTELLRNDLAWEGDVVEGPWIQRRDGRYYLFYAGNGYASASYAVGVARAPSLLGPYEKKGDAILRTNAGWQGPGHCSLTTGPGGDVQMLYHSWYGGRVGGGNPRVLLVDAVAWANGWPLMHAAPSLRSVPLP